MEKSYDEIEGKWSKGFYNTKTFEVPSIFGRGFLQGCKNCNSVVELKDVYKERQFLGNVYQSLCKCVKCDRFIIFDEHKFTLHKVHLNLIF
jgi:hypothetical protein